MLELLSAIGDFFAGVADFVVNLFEDLAFLVRQLGNFLTAWSSWVDFLPSAFGALLISAIGCVVVLRILGR